MTKRTLDELSSDECFELLGQEMIGRIVFVDELGPAALPVNYVLAGRDIVFRSDGGSKIDALDDRPIAFEVDHVDGDTRSGWSVLLRGVAETVEIERVTELLAQIDGGPPLPWKKGIHQVWVVVKAHTVAGRRLTDVAYDDFF